MLITKKEAPPQVVLGAGQVEHIAKLARIELADAEVAKYEKELSAVLGFVDKLSEVDTGDIQPLTGGTDLANVMRDDIGNLQLTTDNLQLELAAELVKAAPEHERGYVKVNKVFEQ